MDTVLIIETDSDTIETISELLSGYGYMVDAVDDIEAARQKVAATPPRLVVIGPQLGKSTGFLACSLIKKIPQSKGVPVVLLYTDREEGQVQRHQNLAGRAEVYLRKPFNLDEFRDAVSAYLTLGDAPAASDLVIEEEVDVGLDAIADEVVEEDVVLPEPAAAPSPEREAELEALRAERETLRTERETLRAELEAVQGRLDASESQAKQAADKLAAAEKKVRALTEKAEQPSEAEGEVTRLQDEVTALQKQLALAQKQAQEALDGAKAKAGSSETRQILELKQTLNKREADVVEFKEASLQKDKSLLELRGKINDLEMKQLELSETVTERDREIGSLKGQVEALAADKDVVAKRAADLDRRFKQSQESLDKTKEEAQAQKAAFEQQLKDKDEAHAVALEQARADLTARKDAEREQALAELTRTLGEEKEAALAAQSTEAEAKVRSQQERHDSEVFEMQERFRRSMNAQEDKLALEKKRALEELQQKHDGQVAELAEGHERELNEVKGRMAEQEKRLEDANQLNEQHVANIAKLGEERDELASQRDQLDNELKASQLSAERLRVDLEAAEARIEELGKTLASTEDVRDSLRTKQETDLTRVEKAKQAVAVAIELLNEIEPL